MADTPSTGSSRTRFELIVELIKALAWPVFAFVLLIALWGPVRSIARQLPGIVARSETITLAGMSIKVSQGLRQQASEEVSRALAELSPDGLRKLIDHGNATFWDDGSDEYARNEVAELVRLGLLAEVPEADLREGDRGYAYGVRPSTLGREAREYLLTLISEFVNELRRSGQAM